MSESVGELTRENFDETVGAHAGLAIVDVWGERCQPCLVLSPYFEELASEYASSAKFLKLQAEKNRMLCAQLRVLSLPTFLLFVDGEEADRLSGDVSVARLRDWIGDGIANNVQEAS